MQLTDALMHSRQRFALYRHLFVSVAGPERLGRATQQGDAGSSNSLL